MSGERIERRLAAILAADVVGYSRLMGQDEAGTLARLKALRRELIDPKIAEHKGRIVKTTGDGLLIEFPSVVEAVACAVAVQRQMPQHNADVPEDKRIEFRVGIHMGDIIVEDGDIFGDGVNVAARLEGLADAGGICVSGRVQEDATGKLDLDFEDTGEQQLRNIARPVRTHRVVLDQRPRPVITNTLSLPNKPSIVVLPFSNMSGDAEQEYFTDGTVEEITTAIARLPWLFVIARNSAFTYKGRAVDVKVVARELGVRYVLEGSVRKGGNRVRITGQLIDTATGAHIWADRFDGNLDDIFELQDRVASHVIGAIEPRLLSAESERAIRKPTENLDAYDLYLRALAKFHQYSDLGFGEAVILMKQALALDRTFAPAAAMVGWCRTNQRSQGFILSPEAVTEAIQFARRAIETGKNDPDVLWMSGHSLAYMAGEHEMGANAIDRAIALNPNSAHAWMARGYVLCFRNQPERAIDAFNHSMRLSPLDPLGWACAGGIAFAYLILRRYEQVIEWADRCLHEQPSIWFALRLKAVSFVYLNRLQEAREQLARSLEIDPGLTVAKLKAYATMFVPAEAFPVYLGGLRKAGLPEE